MLGSNAIIATCAAYSRRAEVGKTGYIGWVGKGNVGDQAMFEAARHLLGDDLEVLQSFTRERFFSLVGRGTKRSFSRIVLGGGTLINQDRLAFVEALTEKNIPLFTLGTGIGSAGFSMETEMLDPAWKEVLGRFQEIGVRGHLSLNKLQELGVQNAQVIGDLALASTPDRPLADYGAKRMIVSWAPQRQPQDTASIGDLRSKMQRFLCQKIAEGWRIMPVAFDVKDVTPLEQLMRDIDCAVKVIQLRNFSHYRELAALVSFSIGIRLHSSVFATACGIPNALIAYRDKCRDFAETVGMQDALIEMGGSSKTHLSDVAERQIEGGRLLGSRLHTECAQWSSKIKRFAKYIATL